MGLGSPQQPCLGRVGAVCLFFVLIGSLMTLTSAQCNGANED